jgi:hypothetical protein
MDPTMSHCFLAFNKGISGGKGEKRKAIEA